VKRAEADRQGSRGELVKIELPFDDAPKRLARLSLQPRPNENELADAAEPSYLDPQQGAVLVIWLDPEVNPPDELVG
jgi:hypothetical protein